MTSTKHQNLKKKQHYCSAAAMQGKYLKNRFAALKNKITDMTKTIFPNKYVKHRKGVQFSH